MSQTDTALTCGSALGLVCSKLSAVWELETVATMAPLLCTAIAADATQALHSVNLLLLMHRPSSQSQRQTHTVARRL